MLFEVSRDSNAIILFIKNWTLIDTIFTIASAWSNAPNKTLGKAWENLMGEVLTMEEADSTSADLSTMLNTISILICIQYQTLLRACRGGQIFPKIIT